MPPSPGGQPVAERALLVRAISSDEPLDSAHVASLEPSFDWQLVLGLAERNRVVPLLSAALRTAVATGGVPEPVATELQRGRATAAVEAQRITGHLAVVTAAFDRADIRTLSFKGPVLAESAYGNIARRQFNDLDILIAPGDRQRSAEVLTAIGFEISDDFGWAASFVDSSQQRCVDLHTDLLHPDFRHGLDFERAWDARRVVSVGEGEVTTFGPAHTLLCAAVQVAKDSIENRLVLQKVADVAAVCRTMTDADWPAVDTEARATRLRRITTTAIEIAAQAGCDIGDVAPQRRDPTTAPTAASALQRLWGEDIDYPKPFVMAERHRRLREHRPDALRPYVRRALAAGPDEDPDAPTLRRLGRRATRPLRLAVRYGRGTNSH